MRIKNYIFISFLLFLLSFQAVTGAENEYGIVRAWFNGKNATVEDIELKMGEPASIKVEVISKINGNIFVEIYEPGVTNAFDVSGPSTQDITIDNYDIVNGWSKEYSWTIVPNGAWRNGNAPLNIFVQFDKIVNGKITGDKRIQFTIANPYILDEQYASIAIQKPTSLLTAHAIQVKAAPFSPAFLGVTALLFLFCMMRKK